MLEKFFESFDPDNPPKIAFYPVDKNREDTTKRLANLLFSYHSYQKINKLVEGTTIEDLINRGFASTMNYDYYEEMYYILMDISNKEYKTIKFDDEELIYEEVVDMFQNLIEFFISYEEYEKCSDLQKVVKMLQPHLTDI